MVEKMSRGRAPCCDKTKVKRGPWSPEEDLRLTTFIRNHGHSNWRALPKQAGLLRCGKSCRLRWINYLTPDVKRGNFTPQEEQTIINLHNSIGNKWSKIASCLPGRTDNEIKNVWNTHLKKRVLKNNDSILLASSSSTLSSVSSSNDQNAGKATVDQDVQASKSPKPNKDSNNSDNSPASSYASNVTNSNDASSEFSKFLEVTNTGNDDKIEIPLESDIDFWNMFDSLDTDPESNNIVSDINPEEKVHDGKECSNWFRLLENELGLTCDGDNLPKDQNNVPTTLEPEIGPGLDYFPIWPSSPQNFGI